MLYNSLQVSLLLSHSQMIQYVILNVSIFILFILVFLISDPRIHFFYISNYKALFTAILVSVVWIIGIGFLISVSYEQVINFLETYASLDGDISNPKEVITLLIITPIFLLAKLVLLLFTSRAFKIRRNLLIIYFIYFGVHILGFLLVSRYHFTLDIPFEDNFLEWGTFAFAIMASIVFFIRGVLGSQFAYLCCIAFFLFAMEEISWGQRVFLIESPELFLQHNYQKELNLHNFINFAKSPIFGLVYFTVNLLILCFLTWFRRIKFFSRFYNIGGVFDFIRVSDKFGLWIVPALLVLATSYTGGVGEFIEEQWALFGFIFSVLMLYDFITNSKLDRDMKNDNL